MSALPFPPRALDQHTIALGKTGAGKSSKLRVVVEHLLEHDKPVCIIDPKGDWWGLKSSSDGRKSGFPIVIFGGEHADVPLNAHAGAQVAELVATGNRSCLIDLGGWMVGERTRFFIDFASALFKHARGARHLVIDEVHNFAPKGKVWDADAAKMLHWANRLASEGRGKGLTLIAASQRPQKVHNDFLTSCETLIACRVIHKADRDAIKDWIDGCADAAKGREVLAELAGMKRPEAWVWSPEIEFGPERITFPLFRTYDSFKPQPAEATKLTGWAAVDLEEVRGKLAAVVAEAEANDPKKLKERIRQLERKVGDLQAELVAGATAEGIRNVEEQTEARVRAELEGLANERAAAAVAALRTEVRPHVEALHHALANGSAVVAPVGEDRKAPGSEGTRGLPARTLAPPASTRRPPAPRPHVRPIRDSHETTIGVGERKILTAVAQHDAGVTREQLSVLTAYKRSSRDTYLQRLSARGLVSVDGQVIRATKEGLDELGDDFEALPTGDALRQHWLERLPQGEGLILAHVVAAYPESIDRDELSEETGYKRSSRDTYLQRLIARKLVEAEGRGRVVASDSLFD